jgi:hypothetical protein
MDFLDNRQWFAEDPGETFAFCARRFSWTELGHFGGHHEIDLAVV